MSIAPAPAASTTLTLPADLGIEGVAALHGQLLGHVDDEPAVVLDARDVQRVHTAALQLLGMFHRDRAGAGRATRWLLPSDALHAAAGVLGLAGLLQLQRETP